MSLIIENTYKLLDVLDNSDVIKNITYYKERLYNNKEILSLVEKYNKEDNIDKKVEIKKILYNNSDYKKYMDCYNELSYIILRVNNKYKEYTNTRNCINNGSNNESN